MSGNSSSRCLCRCVHIPNSHSVAAPATAQKAITVLAVCTLPSRSVGNGSRLTKARNTRFRMSIHPSVDGPAHVEHTMMTHPEDTDDHKRCRVDDKLRQHLPQEAIHLLRGGEVGGHIDGQNEQRYGDGE